MITFLEFIAMQEEAPVAGAGPSAPSSGGGKNVNDLGITTRELGAEFDGLEPEDYLKEPIASFEPLYVGGQPTTSAPIFVDVEDADEDGMTGNVLYSLQNRQKMRNPGNNTQYKGNLKDRRIRLRKGKHATSRTLDDLILGPLSKTSGGAPPMGGGMGMI